MNDDALLASLKDALAPSSEELEQIISLGINSFSWRNVDVELAQLLDEESETLVMRSTESGRHFTFASSGSTIDVAIIPKTDHSLLLGWIEPTKPYIEVSALGSDGAAIETVPVDANGRFKMVLTYKGPIRLEFSEQPKISTDWFTPL
jgi:hypothetical protein